MIYWILHKKLTISDWKNEIEGNPCYFYEKIPNLCFIDISTYTLFAKIENFLLGVNKENDISEFGISTERYIKISNFKVLKKFLKSTNENDLFIFQSLADIRTKSLVKILNECYRKTALLNHWKPPIANPIPMKRDFSFIKSVFKKNPKLLFLRLLFRIYKFAEKKNLRINYLLSGGNKLTEQIKKDFLVENVVPVHSISYDEYLKVNKTVQESLIKEKYFVFVDQAITIHPDNKGFSEEDSLLYQKEILNSLELISNQNENINIIIAEHPRIQYEKDFWKNYARFAGKTAALIKYSAGVIGHFSTALLLAQIYQKKIYLLKSSSLYFPFNARVENAGKILDSIIIDMKSNQIVSEVGGKESCLVTDYFTLLPESEKQNTILFMEFFRQYF